jgi:hypothetical protein
MRGTNPVAAFEALGHDTRLAVFRLLIPAGPDGLAAGEISEADLKDRIGWIRELSAKSLRSHRRDGLMLELTYDASAAPDVHDLVRREKACCGFLRLQCA